RAAAPRSTTPRPEDPQRARRSDTEETTQAGVADGRGGPAPGPLDGDAAREPTAGLLPLRAILEDVPHLELESREPGGVGDRRERQRLRLHVADELRLGKHQSRTPRVLQVARRACARVEGETQPTRIEGQELGVGQK